MYAQSLVHPAVFRTEATATNHNTLKKVNIIYEIKISELTQINHVVMKYFTVSLFPNKFHIFYATIEVDYFSGDLPFRHNFISIKLANY